VTTSVTPANQFMTVYDASRYTGLSEGSIRNKIVRAEIPARRLARRILIERAVLDNLVQPIQPK
jgi:excisionase family DNA binding protein